MSAEVGRIKELWQQGEVRRSVWQVTCILHALLAPLIYST